jgi:hypothetical protein
MKKKKTKKSFSKERGKSLEREKPRARNVPTSIPLFNSMCFFFDETKSTLEKGEKLRHEGFIFYSFLSMKVVFGIKS